LAREIRSKRSITATLTSLARAALAREEQATARALLEEAHAYSRGTEACMEQGHILLEMGDYAAARARYEEGLAIRRPRGNSVPTAWTLLEVGHAAWLQGEPRVTHAHALESLTLFQERDHPDGLLAALESVAAARLAQGQKERAALLMAAVEAQREALGPP